MKRSFVPAGIFVLTLLVAAVAMKYYAKYEYHTAMDAFLRAEAVYTLADAAGETALTDPESRVALAGFLQGVLALDHSVNGDPETPQGDVYEIRAAGGATLVISASDPELCYIQGRFFTHYFTGGGAAAEYLEALLGDLRAA